MDRLKVEILKVSMESRLIRIEYLFKLIWEKEIILEDWRRGENNNYRIEIRSYKR